MPKLVWMNGVISELETATVSVADHAHLYGDGLFEGIRIYDGRIFKLDEHLSRLYHGIKHMGIRNMIPQPELREIVLSTCRKSEIMAGYIRLNVTRGTGLGLNPDNIDQTPNVMVMVSSLALYPPEAFEVGLSVVTTSYRVIESDALDPRLKAIGRYAANIMAKQEANSRGAGEGLMLNNQGLVAECTGDNLFIIKDSVIYTPDKSSGILAGITRQTVIDLARKEGVEVVECQMSRFDIFAADEAFLTGTAAEVIPMISLDERMIDDGRPGTMTKQIMKLFKEETLKGVPFADKVAL